jgi:hypothetical protein
MRATVTNISHTGTSFCPQNLVKIGIGENKFDAEDIDPNFEYLNYIEPTMSKGRDFYFEIPSKDAGSFALRFSTLFEKELDVNVTADTHEPAPSATPLTKPDLSSADFNSAMEAAKADAHRGWDYTLKTHHPPKHGQKLNAEGTKAIGLKHAKAFGSNGALAAAYAEPTPKLCRPCLTNIRAATKGHDHDRTRASVCTARPSLA